MKSTTTARRANRLLMQWQKQVNLKERIRLSRKPEMRYNNWKVSKFRSARNSQGFRLRSLRLPSTKYTGEIAGRLWSLTRIISIESRINLNLYLKNLRSPKTVLLPKYLYWKNNLGRMKPEKNPFPMTLRYSKLQRRCSKMVELKKRSSDNTSPSSTS